MVAAIKRNISQHGGIMYCDVRCQKTGRLAQHQRVWVDVFRICDDVLLGYARLNWWADRDILLITLIVLFLSYICIYVKSISVWAPSLACIIGLSNSVVLQILFGRVPTRVKEVVLPPKSVFLLIGYIWRVFVYRGGGGGITLTYLTMTITFVTCWFHCYYRLSALLFSPMLLPFGRWGLWQRIRIERRRRRACLPIHVVTLYGDDGA